MAERHGASAKLSTPSPLRGSISVNLDYHIRVPRAARLIIEHEGGRNTY
jgi:hypothetical protein